MHLSILQRNARIKAAFLLTSQQHIYRPLSNIFLYFHLFLLLFSFQSTHWQTSQQHFLVFSLVFVAFFLLINTFTAFSATFSCIFTCFCCFFSSNQHIGRPLSNIFLYFHLFLLLFSFQSPHLQPFQQHFLVFSLVFVAFFLPINTLAAFSATFSVLSSTFCCFPSTFSQNTFLNILSKYLRHHSFKTPSSPFSQKKRR